MCGIFGWQVQKKAHLPAGGREAMAAVLAVANAERGNQSWGVLTQSEPGAKFRIRREVGSIARASGFAGLGAAPLVMAHTRYATTGSVTRDNQHPFTEIGRASCRERV